MQFTREMHARSKVIAKGCGIKIIGGFMKQYGGPAKDWAKKKTWDDLGREVHYYQHPAFGTVQDKYVK